MRKLIALAATTAVALAGCGGARTARVRSDANTPQAKAAEQRLERQVVGAIPKKDGQPDPLLLRAKPAREAFLARSGLKAAGPKAYGCAVKVILAVPPRKARIEAGLVACAERYA